MVLSKRFMHHTCCWLLAAGLSVCLPLCAAAESTARASAGAGEARFEFLTPSLVRMEYSPTGQFVDAPTAVVQKRDWPAVHVTTTQAGGWLVEQTSAMTLRYRLHSGPFTASNLVVRWSSPAGGAGHEWHPGDVDARNLGGLTYSLDNISAPNLPKDGKDLQSPVNDIIPGIEVLLPPAQPGLLSRSGYAVIDDSTTPVWNAQKAWIEPRPQTGGQDWYLFTYGTDYRSVLQTYAELCGPVPMIPRYTLGPWITDFNFEYFPDSADARQPAFQRYNAQHLKDEVTRLRDEGIPFDGLVLDFAWHNYGWDGGFDWSPLVPHPKQLLDWLHGQGIKVSLNDHPGYVNTEESVVSYDDSHAPAALAALGQPLPPKPAFDRSLSNAWQFAADPNDWGLSQTWFAPDANVRWSPIETGMSWEEQGRGKGIGIAWYRTSVSLPAQLPASLYLVFGEVASSYRLFVNGHEATHSQIQWAAAGHLCRRRPVHARRRAQYHRAARRRRQARQRPPGQPYRAARRQAAAADFFRPLRSAASRQLHADPAQAAAGSGRGVLVDRRRQRRGRHARPGQAAVDQQGVLRRDRAGDRQTRLHPRPLWRLGQRALPGLFHWRHVFAVVRCWRTRSRTARAPGNVLVPYVSHDIGGFHGAKIDFDLYARWIEFGAFSPILRMHSAHANPLEGNVRMPWLYGAQGVALMKKYFTLHTQLIPYVYSYAWQAHTASLPIMRPLYLAYPQLDEAYQHPHEYFFGEQMLVAPVPRSKR